MALNEKLNNKVRKALGNGRNIEEKKMFRGVAFMVNGKMLISAGDDEVMIRVAPEDHEEVIEKVEGRSMIMRGKDCRGYIYIHEKKMSTKAFSSVLEKALAYNKTLLTSKSKAKKKKQSF